MRATFGHMESAMNKPTITTGTKGEYLVSDHEGGVKTFKATAAGEAIAAYNAAMAAYDKANEPSEIKAALDYRGQLHILGPRGFSAFEGTQESFDWLERNFGAIIATFKANKAKVVTADKIGKALPKGQPRPDKTPVAVVRPE